MIRAVVHRAVATTEAQATNANAIQADNFADKLVKYIPAEAIAFYTPVYAYVHANVETGGVVDKGPLTFVVAITILGLLGYLYARGRSDGNSSANTTSWFYYPLAVVAFACWAAGTSTVAQDLAGLPEWWDNVILLTGVFLVPLVDELLTGKTTRS